MPHMTNKRLTQSDSADFSVDLSALLKLKVISAASLVTRILHYKGHEYMYAVQYNEGKASNMHTE